MEKRLRRGMYPFLFQESRSRNPWGEVSDFVRMSGCDWILFLVFILILSFCLDSDSEKDPGRDGFVGISMVGGHRLVGYDVFYGGQPVGKKTADVDGKRSVVDRCGGIGFVCFELAGAICATPHPD
jgi:hypothetical protein